MIQLSVDFNTLIGDGLLLADMPSQSVQVGEWVAVSDEDGNRAIATVDEVDPEDQVLYLAPIWQTWISGDDEHHSVFFKMKMTNASCVLQNTSDLKNTSGLLEHKLQTFGFFLGGAHPHTGVQEHDVHDPSTYGIDSSVIKVRSRS
jgi:hypothetical protein